MKKYSFALLLLLFSFAQLAQGQKRYSHVPRVKVRNKTELSLTKVMMKESSVESNSSVAEVVLADELVIESLFSDKSVISEPPVKSDHLNPTKEKQIYIHSKKKAYKPAPVIQRPVFKTKRSELGVSKVMKVNHPNQVMLTKGTLSTIGWLCLVFAFCFLGGAIINLVIGGYSLIVLLFFIATGIFVIGGIVSLVVAPHLDED